MKIINTTPISSGNSKWEFVGNIDRRISNIETFTFHIEKNVDSLNNLFIAVSRFSDYNVQTVTGTNPYYVVPIEFAKRNSEFRNSMAFFNSNNTGSVNEGCYINFSNIDSSSFDINVRTAYTSGSIPYDFYIMLFVN